MSQCPPPPKIQELIRLDEEFGKWPIIYTIIQLFNHKATFMTSKILMPLNLPRFCYRNSSRNSIKPSLHHQNNRTTPSINNIFLTKTVFCGPMDAQITISETEPPPGQCGKGSGNDVENWHFWNVPKTHYLDQPDGDLLLSIIA